MEFFILHLLTTKHSSPLERSDTSSSIIVLDKHMQCRWTDRATNKTKNKIEGNKDE